LDREFSRQQYSLADLHGSDDGSVIASWVSAAGFTGPKHLLAMITGAKLDPSGAFLCSPFAVSSILSSTSRLDLTLSLNDVALAAWSDGRADGGDIYAQDIKPGCSLGQ